MATIKEQFGKVINQKLHIVRDDFDGTYDMEGEDNAVNELETITDQFAVEFGRWLKKKNDKIFTYQELLRIFKEEKGL